MIEQHDDLRLAADDPHAAGGTDVGQVREGNEDAFLCAPGRGLYIVADGMGGHAAGEQASAAAIRVLQDRLTRARLGQAAAAGDEAVRDLLCEALSEANEAIVAIGAAHPELAGLGTTAVVAVVVGDRCFVVNAGDSRAYLVHGRAATLLTRDHSVAAVLVENGMIPPEELRAHPRRNSLTMALGSQQPLRPAFAAQDWHRGDRLLLCSDGLWEMVEDEDIAGIVRFSSTPQEAVYSLIAEADAAGGHDNITAVVVFR